jgi:hypothetical protein
MVNAANLDDMLRKKNHCVVVAKLGLLWMNSPLDVELVINFGHSGRQDI